MGEHVDKLAGLHQPDADVETYVALARVVRSLEGAKRFRTPLGAPIQTRPKELKKLEKPTQIDPATGRVKQVGKTGEQNHKLFEMRVAELQDKLKKLDTNAIKNLLNQLESAKDLPKSANYQKIREMLKKYLQEKSGKDDQTKDKVLKK